MPTSIENYVPQIAVRRQRRQAVFAWGVIFTVALVWMFSIVFAPVGKASGFESFSNSVYSFFSYLCHQMSWRSYQLYEHPLAVCARCFGFYGGFFIGLAAYPFFRQVSNTDSFPRFWLFMAMIPMGADWFLEAFGVWQNTHLSRVISGAILGAACAFFIVPAVVEINYFLCEKFRRNL